MSVSLLPHKGEGRSTRVVIERGKIERPIEIRSVIGATPAEGRQIHARFDEVPAMGPRQHVDQLGASIGVILLNLRASARERVPPNAFADARSAASSGSLLPACPDQKLVQQLRGGRRQVTDIELVIAAG